MFPTGNFLRISLQACGCDNVCNGESRDLCEGVFVKFKIPRYLRFVDMLLMPVTGKVQESDLGGQPAKGLGIAA